MEATISRNIDCISDSQCCCGFQRLEEENLILPPRIYVIIPCLMGHWMAFGWRELRSLKPKLRNTGRLGFHIFRHPLLPSTLFAHFATF
ncbi:hypothetical protein VTN02DRAFT_5044 [Thermoascus thermophilus]